MIGLLQILIKIETSVDLEENAQYLYAQNISKLNTLGLESEIWFNLFTENSININGSLGYVKSFHLKKLKIYSIMIYN